VKILFLNPISRTSSIPIFPMGMGYLSSCLRAAGYGDIKGCYGDEPAWKCEARDAAFIGLHVTTVTFDEAVALAREARAINPAAVIAVGGPHASLRPQELLAVEEIDMAAVGEAEDTIVELMRALEKSGAEREALLAEIHGLCWKKGAEVVVNPKRERRTDLDAIPFPDRTLFRNSINRHLFGASTDMLAGRSCIYNCANCMPALRRIMGKHRMRSVENVVAEMEELRRQGITQIHFNDNSLTHFRAWTVKLCESLIEKRLGIRWTTPVCERELDLELLRTMKRAGCISVAFGIESGSPRVLKEVLRKKVDLEHVLTVIKWCNDLKLFVHAWFMMAIPGETKEEARRTVDYAVGLDLNSASFHISSPNPCTGYEEVAAREGWNRAKSYADLDNLDRRPMIVTPHYDEEYVRSLDARLIEEFGKRGWEFVRDKHSFHFFNSRRNFRQRPVREAAKRLLRILGLRRV